MRILSGEITVASISTPFAPTVVPLPPITASINETAETTETTEATEAEAKLLETTEPRDPTDLAIESTEVVGTMRISHSDGITKAHTGVQASLCDNKFFMTVMCWVLVTVCCAPVEASVQTSSTFCVTPRGSCTGELHSFQRKEGALNPFDQVANVGFNSKPAFVDADNDGDMDLVIGREKGDLKFYYENTGSPTNPSYTRREGALNPFDQVADVG